MSQYNERCLVTVITSFQVHDSAVHIYTTDYHFMYRYAVCMGIYMYYCGGKGMQ